MSRIKRFLKKTPAMKVKTSVVANFLTLLAISVVLMAGSGCMYPKTERLPGAMTSDVTYEVVGDTAVIEERRISGRWWVTVHCDYWAGCFMRCDGQKSQCRQLAEDAQFNVLSISP